MTTTNVDSGIPYHSKCTGMALPTVEKHDAPEEITFFALCYCPFVQRVWLAFEFLEIPYTYYEVDAYKKPRDLLEVSPQGLVPAIKLNGYSPARSVHESAVIMGFLQDLAANTTKRSLLPPIANPYARAMVRLQADHVDKNLVPAFYRFLKAQDPAAQTEASSAFHNSIKGLADLFERIQRELLGATSPADFEAQVLTVGLGLYFNTEDLGWIDLMAGPFLFRATNVLKRYRGFTLSGGEKFDEWTERLFNHQVFQATCSTEDVYLDSYRRLYPLNQPSTRQVAEL